MYREQRLVQRLLLAWLGAVKSDHRNFPPHAATLLLEVEAAT
jgi:hypothetical protein